MKYTIPKFVTAKAESRIMIHLVITGKRDKVANKQKSQIAVILIIYQHRIQFFVVNYGIQPDNIHQFHHQG
jgi:hypothetical protein